MKSLFRDTFGECTCTRTPTPNASSRCFGVSLPKLECTAVLCMAVGFSDEGICRSVDGQPPLLQAAGIATQDEKLTSHYWKARD
jgi:hypothetical protein